ncbi:MAG: glycosyltransferase family 4 protein [Planctomycetes bacterium]|nr:glycosyltransferase family 4 protein [Planctomycetota bacterium]
MKLALDARSIYRADRRGTGKNLIDLYHHLVEARPEWRVVMLHQGEAADDPFAGYPNVERRRIDIKGDRLNLWQQVRLPLAVRAVRADVLHCPANTAPRLPGAPMVVTIHDLIPLDERFATPASRKWGRNVSAAAKKADRILTPTQFSRELIARTFGVSADKITVNHWAPDSGCREEADTGELNRVRANYGLQAGRRYVLGFGGADPRKNTDALIAAWSKLPAGLRNDYVLLIVGVQEPALEKFRRQAEGAGLNGSCLLHGFAREADIPALLSGAEVLCYASRSEGFGLPILDAFACGTAVLTSNVTSMPEVAGNAAVLVDPEDILAIAGGLVRLLTDEALRAELVNLGRKRVKEFTWADCAERAACVFEEAAG